MNAAIDWLKSKIIIIAGLAGLAALAGLIMTAPEVESAPKDPPVCRATLIIDRTKYARADGMRNIRQQIPRLFQPGGVDDDYIEIAFWSYSHEDSGSSVPSGTPDLRRNSPGYFPFVGSGPNGANRDQLPYFNSALNALRDSGKSNWVHGFGFDHVKKAERKGKKKNKKWQLERDYDNNKRIEKILNPTDLLIFMAANKPDEPKHREKGKKHDPDKEAEIAADKRRGEVRRLIGFKADRPGESYFRGRIDSPVYSVGNKYRNIGQVSKDQILYYCEEINPHNLTCSINITENVPKHPAGGADVKNNENFDVSIEMTNRERQRTVFARHGIVADINDGWQPLISTASNTAINRDGNPQLIEDIGPGQTKTLKFQAKAPPDVTSKNFQAFLNHRGFSNNSCDQTVRVFKYFQLEGEGAKLTLEYKKKPYNEDPDNVNFNFTLNNIYEPPKNIRVQYDVTDSYRPYQEAARNIPPTPLSRQSARTPVLYDRDYEPPPPKAGDQYCINVYLYQQKGWGGPGDIFGEVDPKEYNHCQVIYDRPYLRAYGGDIFAGTASLPCSAADSNQTIKGAVSPWPAKSGTGGQLGVYANGPIDQFISATLRNITAQPNTNLTFANTEDTAPWGGNFGQSACAPDYWASRDRNAPELLLGDLSTIRTRSGKFNYATSGILDLKNGAELKGQKAVYADGDVYITDNITYADIDNYGGSVVNIPRFTLITRGNIYISKDVTQLDGLYVAGGKISTCANSGGSYPLNQLWDNCRSRLVVNGQFLAPRVDMLRVLGSVRQTSRSPDQDGANRNFAAELFLFNPEAYLAPLFGDSGGGSSNSQPTKYDAYTTLPPIL